MGDVTAVMMSRGVVTSVPFLSSDGHAIMYKSATVRYSGELSVVRLLSGRLSRWVRKREQELNQEQQLGKGHHRWERLNRQGRSYKN